MREKLTVLFLAILLCALPAAAESAQKHRLGGGVHYWVTLDDIDVDNFDESGAAWMLSYQYVPGALLKFEADLEIFPSGFGGSEEAVFAPQAFVLLGSGLYGGLGVGAFHADGDFSNDPFFVLRAGFDMEVVPGLHLDLNANYTFPDFDDIKDVPDTIDTDTITLGAMMRLGF